MTGGLLGIKNYTDRERAAKQILIATKNEI